MIIQICEKCHKPITCPLDACVCHAIKSEREKIIKWANKMKKYQEEIPVVNLHGEGFGQGFGLAMNNLIKKLN